MSSSYFDSIGNSIYVSQERFTGVRNMPLNHYHNAYELYYLLEGERYYFIKDRTYHITRGNLVFINMNDLHKTMDAGVPVHQRILINFKKDFLSNILKDSADVNLLSFFELDFNVLKLNMQEQTFVESILFRIVSESKKNEKGSALCLKVLITELLIFLFRCTSHSKNTHFEHHSPLYKKISEIVMYINTSYMNDLSLEAISHQFYISSYYLSRTFKEVTGFTFTEYLNSVRTREAQKLLLQTKLNVTEISEKVGYQSSTHFGRVFKAITGLSPLKYKQKERK